MIQGAKTESVPLGELKKLASERMLLFDEELMSYSMENCIAIHKTRMVIGNYRKVTVIRRYVVAAMMDAYAAYKLNKESFEETYGTILLWRYYMGRKKKEFSEEQINKTIETSRKLATLGGIYARTRFLQEIDKEDAGEYSEEYVDRTKLSAFDKITAANLLIKDSRNNTNRDFLDRAIDAGQFISSKKSQKRIIANGYAEIERANCLLQEARLNLQKDVRVGPAQHVSNYKNNSENKKKNYLPTILMILLLIFGVSYLYYVLLIYF